MIATCAQCSTVVQHIICDFTEGTTTLEPCGHPSNITVVEAA